MQQRSPYIERLIMAQQDIIIEEEAEELSLQSIFDQLSTTKELILTIPADEEQPLRKGLAMVKSKFNTKLRDSGIQPDKEALHFQVTPHLREGKKVEGVIDIQVRLAPRNGITVISMKVPDPNI